MPDWYYERIKACEKCELNSKNKKELNLKQKILYLLNSLKPFCTVCSCQILAKSSEPEEICGLEQLGEESKWKNIKTE